MVRISKILSCAAPVVAVTPLFAQSVPDSQLRNGVYEPMRFSQHELVGHKVSDPSDPSISLAHTFAKDWGRYEITGGATSRQELGELLDRLAAEQPDVWWSPTYLSPTGLRRSVLPDLFIRFHATATERDIQKWFDQTGYPVLESRWGGMERAYSIAHTARHGGELLGLANTLATDPMLKWAEPDWFAEIEPTSNGGPCEAPVNDPLFFAQWGLHNTGDQNGKKDFDINLLEALNLSQPLATIKVVVLDDGVQLNHPDFQGAYGFDFTQSGTGGNHGNGCDRHGTAVAGCVGAITNNGIGVASFGSGAQILSARISYGFTIPSGSCSDLVMSQSSWWVSALNWAQNQGARVSNSSYDLSFNSSSLDDKFSETASNGMIHFASIGNNGSNIASHPASLTSVIAVGAANRFGSRSNFSQWGPQLDLLAPGESILTTDRTGSLGYADGDYAIVNGTSFASPIAASVAAVILAQQPTLSVASVRAALFAGCQDIGPVGIDDFSGHGMLNAFGSFVARGWAMDLNEDLHNDDCQDVGLNYCGPATPNGTGMPAVIRGIGSADVSTGVPFVLEAMPVTSGTWGYALVSMTQDFVPMAGGGIGNLCLGGQVFRTGDAQTVITSGPLLIPIDIHGAIDPWPVVSGETWNFQVWFRDLAAGVVTSNMSDGLSVSFF